MIVPHVLICSQMQMMISFHCDIIRGRSTDIRFIARYIYTHERCELLKHTCTRTAPSARRPRPLLPKAAPQIAPPHGHDHVSFPAHTQSFCNIIFILCRERVLVIRHTRIKTSPAKISHDATTCCYQSLVHDRYSHRRKKTLAVCSSTKACSITHEL
jgi:hypothetical protein